MKRTGILGFADDLTLGSLFFTNQRMTRLSMLSLLAILLSGCAEEYPEEWVVTYVKTVQKLVAAEVERQENPLLEGTFLANATRTVSKHIPFTETVTLRKDGTATLQGDIQILARSDQSWDSSERDETESFEGTWKYDNGRIYFYWSMGSSSQEQNFLWLCEGRHLQAGGIWKRQAK